LASQGASVVVNDVGGDSHGYGSDSSPAQTVADEIVSTGCRAASSAHDVANWAQAEDLIRFAIDTFGALHILVNNAGIIRDRTLANMTEEEWDGVVRVHLKGHAAMSHHAMAYWKGMAKAGTPLFASVINTTSVSAFTGNYGQANYSAAKAGILGLSSVIALEGASYGVRSNAVSPSALTRITAGGLPSEKDVERLDPANVSPLVGWLAEEKCPANAQIFQLIGDRLVVSSMPPIVHVLRADAHWTLADLDRELPQRLVRPLTVAEFLE